MEMLVTLPSLTAVHWLMILVMGITSGILLAWTHVAFHLSFPWWTALSLFFFSYRKVTGWLLLPCFKAKAEISLWWLISTVFACRPPGNTCWFPAAAWLSGGFAACLVVLVTVNFTPSPFHLQHEYTSCLHWPSAQVLWGVKSFSKAHWQLKLGCSSACCSWLVTMGRTSHPMQPPLERFSTQSMGNETANSPEIPISGSAVGTASARTKVTIFLLSS